MDSLLVFIYKNILRDHNVLNYKENENNICDFEFKASFKLNQRL